MTVAHIHRARILAAIAAETARQIRRRHHAALLQSVIDFYDRKIANLQAQLTHHDGGKVCADESRPSLSARSVTDASADPATNP